MIRCLLDSMIYDQLAEHEACRKLLIRLCEQGLVEVLFTHIQADQLEKTPDAVKRKLLLATAQADRSTNIPTDGAVWGLSKWEKSRWGSGRGEINIDDIADGKTKQYPDAYWSQPLPQKQLYL